MNPKTDENAHRLWRLVISPLAGLVGKRLCTVIYRCLDGEASAEAVATEYPFWFGGEVELRFEDAEPTFLSWEEKVGWPDAHFSFGVRNESFFLPERLCPFEANSSRPWDRYVGETLLGCSIIGEGELPLAVEFTFNPGTVIVGTGSGDLTFCEADDILILNGRDFSGSNQFGELRRLWGPTEADSAGREAGAQP